MTMTEELIKKPKRCELVSIHEIYVGDRARADDDYGDLAELAESIRKGMGTIENMVVEDAPDLDGGFRFRLLAGGRRYRAIVTHIGADYQDWVTIFSDLDAVDRKFIELEENLQRRQLKWDTEVQMRAELHQLQQERFGITPAGRPQGGEKTGHSIGDTAKLLNMSRGNLTKDLKLAEAMKEVPELRDCKTKKDALKTMDRMEEDILIAEKARRARAKQATENRSRLTQCYIVGDFFEKVKEVPDNIINFCEVDPPYAIDQQNLNYTEGRKELAGRFQDWAVDDYMKNVPVILDECYRVSRDGAWIILWCSASLLPETMAMAQASEWKFSKKPGFWTKYKVGRVMDPDRSLTCDYEPFLYGYKGMAKLSLPGHSSLFAHAHPPKTERIHPNEKPEALLRELLNVFTLPGDKVMSPFLGGGNIILAAADLDRVAFGFDAEQSFMDQFTIRIETRDNTPVLPVEEEDEDDDVEVIE